MPSDSVLSIVFATCLGLAGAASSLPLQQRLPLANLPSAPQQLDIWLFEDVNSAQPILVQGFDRGQFDYESDQETATVSVSLEAEIKLDGHWLQFIADGQPMGERVRVATTGVTFAGSNVLDMSGNGIVNLSAPALDTDAATKGYVDTAIGGPKNLSCTNTSISNFMIDANSINFFNNPACPAGYTATTPYCWTASTGVFSQGSGYNANIPGNQTFCAWANTTGASQTVFGGNVCCRVP